MSPDQPNPPINRENQPIENHFFASHLRYLKAHRLCERVCLAFPPMGIFDDGFLSEEANKRASEIADGYPQLFHYLKDVNTKGHEIGRMAIARDANDYITLAFYARALSGFQCLIFMLKKGFVSESRATCRNLLEVKFRLGFLENEKNAGRLFIAEHERHRIRRLEAIRDGKIILGSDLEKPDFDRLINDARLRLKDSNGKELFLPKIAKLAKKAGFESDYLGHFSTLSAAVHSGAGELNDYIRFDSKANPIGFRYGPTGGSWLTQTALLSASTINECIRIVSRILGLSASHIHQFLEKKEKGMYNLYYSESMTADEEFDS